MPERLTEAEIAETATEEQLAMALRAAYAELDTLRLAGEWLPTHRDKVHGFEIRLIAENNDRLTWEFEGRATGWDYRNGFNYRFEPIPPDAPSETEPDGE